MLPPTADETYSAPTVDNKLETARMRPSVTHDVSIRDIVGASYGPPAPLFSLDLGIGLGVVSLSPTVGS